jgi:hypothetical protein
MTIFKYIKGFRPKNSYILHKAYSNSETYNYTFAHDLTKQHKIKDDRPIGNLIQDELQVNNK